MQRRRRPDLELNTATYRLMVDGRSQRETYPLASSARANSRACSAQGLTSFLSVSASVLENHITQLGREQCLSPKVWPSSWMVSVAARRRSRSVLSAARRWRAGENQATPLRTSA